MTPFFGQCATDFLGGHRINPIWARRICELWGDGALVRYGPQWQDLVKGSDVSPGGVPLLSWQQTDDDIGTLTDAKLRTNFNLQGVARYAANGSSCYLEGVEGCLWWNDPNDGSKGLRFTPERPDCVKPPDPDATAISDVAGQVVTRYPNLAMIEFLNETDDRTSSAAIMNQTELRFGGDPDKTAEWVTEKFLRPFYQGACAASAEVTVGGGEFSTPGFMAASLRYQNEIGAAWHHQYTTVHLYAGSGRFPDDTFGALDLILRFMTELREKDGIDIGKVIIGETGREHGEDPNGWISLLGRLFERRDVIQNVIILSDDMWTPESIRDRDPLRNTYEPSPLYGKLQRMVQQQTSRHRAVQH